MTPCFFINPNSLQAKKLQSEAKPKGENKMRLIEWEVKEDDYQEQIIIPGEQRKIAAEEGMRKAV